jgi:hypothetical protein
MVGFFPTLLSKIEFRYLRFSVETFFQDFLLHYQGLNTMTKWAINISTKKKKKQNHNEQHQLRYIYGIMPHGQKNKWDIIYASWWDNLEKGLGTLYLYC